MKNKLRKQALKLSFIMFASFILIIAIIVFELIQKI
jgi:hypothetical protein